MISWHLKMKKQTCPCNPKLMHAEKVIDVFCWMMIANWIIWYGCGVCVSWVLKHYWFRVGMILAVPSVFGFQTLTTKLVQRTPQHKYYPLCWHTSWPKSGSKSAHSSPLYRPFWWSIIWITKLVPPQNLLILTSSTHVFLGTLILNKKIEQNTHFLGWILQH